MVADRSILVLAGRLCLLGSGAIVQAQGNKTFVSCACRYAGGQRPEPLPTCFNECLDLPAALPEANIRIRGLYPAANERFNQVYTPVGKFAVDNHTYYRGVDDPSMYFYDSIGCGDAKGPQGPPSGSPGASGVNMKK